MFFVRGVDDRNTISLEYVVFCQTLISSHKAVLGSTAFQSSNVFYALRLFFSNGGCKLTPGISSTLFRDCKFRLSNTTTNVGHVEIFVSYSTTTRDRFLSRFNGIHRFPLLSATLTIGPGAFNSKCPETSYRPNNDDLIS